LSDRRPPGRRKAAAADAADAVVWRPHPATAGRPENEVVKLSNDETGADLVPARRRRRPLPLIDAPEELLEEMRERARLSPGAKKFLSRSKAENTETSYQSEWGLFLLWCEQKGASPLPAKPADTANFLSYLATFGAEPELDRLLERHKARKLSSIRHALDVISAVHKNAGLSSPRGSATVKEVLDGMARTMGAEVTQKKGIMGEDLPLLVSSLPDTLLGKRDKALILLGWSGAFRRSELVALDMADLSMDKHNRLTATVKKHTVGRSDNVVPGSKTDQGGVGHRKAIHASKDKRICPDIALREWLEAAEITAGPLFRPFALDGTLLRDRRLSPQSVALVIQKQAHRVGLDPGKDGFAAHSLRRGFVSTAKRKGKGDKEVMRQTGHKKHDTLMKYHETVGEFDPESAGYRLLDDVADEAGPSR